MRPSARLEANENTVKIQALMDHYTGYLDGDEVVFRVIKTQLSTQLGEQQTSAAFSYNTRPGRNPELTKKRCHSLGSLGDILANQTDKCLAREMPPCKGEKALHYLPEK